MPTTINPPKHVQTILITKDNTLVNDEPQYPDSITVVLDSGVAYNIDEIIRLLQADDKAKSKRQFNPLAKAKRFTTAFKTAFKETMDDDEHQHVNT